MTTTVMGQDDEGVTRTPRIIVLALNAPQAQTYLSPDNSVLAGLLRAPIVRADIGWESMDHIELLVRDEWGESRSERFADTYENLSWREIKERKRDKKWLAEQLGEHFLTRMHRTLLGDDDDLKEQVCRVFFDARDKESVVLRLAVESFFPNAVAYSVDKQRGSFPTKAWEIPLCPNCLTEMRESGVNAFLCEGCGELTMKAL